MILSYNVLAAATFFLLLSKSSKFYSILPIISSLERTVILDPGVDVEVILDLPYGYLEFFTSLCVPSANVTFFIPK
jgi:hypothetical protein